MPWRGELVVEVLEDCWDGAVVDSGQVVENVLCLVFWSQATDSDLARLPQQEDRLAKSADESSLLRWRRVVAERLYEVRHVEEFRENRTAR